MKTVIKSILVLLLLAAASTAQTPPPRPLPVLTLSTNTTKLPDNTNLVGEVWLQQIGMADGIPGGMGIDSFGGTIPSPFSSFSVLDFRRANNKADDPTALSTGDLIGVIGWMGYGATKYSHGAAQIRGLAKNSWSDSDHSTRIAVLTTTSGMPSISGLGGGTLERLSISDDGVVIKTTDVAVATQGKGIILRATDGTNCFRLTVNNLGMLATTSVACP